jgi:nicotinamide mononucleotide (NMN) deamidase PncC
VAGPDPQAGHEVGEVYVAVVDSVGEHVERFSLQPGAGSADSEQVRSRIRQDTVDAALGQIRARLGSL